jgi:hypothetical protein
MTRFHHFKTAFSFGTNGGALGPAAAPGQGTGRSRLEVIAMLVTSILGIIGLAALSNSVVRPKADSPNGGMIVRWECLNVWLHPALYDLARRFSESGELPSQEALLRNAEQPGLKEAWYILTLRAVQANGQSAVISMIRRPYETAPAFSDEFVDVLATAAGRPPRSARIDYLRAEIGVVPDRLLSLDPREAFDELRTPSAHPDRH